MNIRDIQATSLSGMKDEKSLGEKTTVEIQPMELKTYRIKFHWIDQNKYILTKTFQLRPLQGPQLQVRKINDMQ